VASTFGVLGSVARKYAHKIPFIVKLNHNELLTYPNKFDQIMFGRSSRRRHGRGRVGATIYFGSDESAADRRGQRGLRPRRTSWAWPPSSGATCATTEFKKDKDYHVSADLTGQANHLGVTIEADIIKQKLPENNGGYKASTPAELPTARLDKRIYTEAHDRPPDRPDPLPGRQLLHGPRGPHQLGRRLGRERLRRGGATAVINKRAGGMGLISGRKAFQRPMAEGVKLLNAIQDVYLEGSEKTVSKTKLSLSATSSRRSLSATAAAS
jgi:fructose-bisphosphate aldolase, class I